MLKYLQTDKKKKAKEKDISFKLSEKDESIIENVYTMYIYIYT